MYWFNRLFVNSMMGFFLIIIMEKYGFFFFGNWNYCLMILLLLVYVIFVLIFYKLYEMICFLVNMVKMEVGFRDSIRFKLTLI